MFDKNRLHFMNVYYKETEKPFGYLLMDSNADTPPDKQVLADLFWGMLCLSLCCNSTEPIRVETKPAGKHSTTPVTKTKPTRKLQAITWSDVPIDDRQ